jgi:hypothetical protein
MADSWTRLDLISRPSISAQDLLFQIKDESRCDANCGEERISAAVITRSNAPSVFELSKHAFHLMALFIQRF